MYLISYFTDETLSVHLARSADLLHWELMNGGEPVLKPDRGYLIRDPFLMKGKDGLFRAVFTDNWISTTVGFSESSDLMNWTPIRHIPVMSGFGNVLNCWAPECFYNREEDCHQLIWSSSFGEEGWNAGNRIWTAQTADFIQFGKPRLFFDPGYAVIDASVLPEEKGYRMAFKDERGSNRPDTDYKAIRTCQFAKVGEDFTESSDLLTKNLCEGPCQVKKDGIYYLFYDSFGDKKYRVSCSRDYKSWKEVTENADFPMNCKHMSIIEY